MRGWHLLLCAWVLWSTTGTLPSRAVEAWDTRLQCEDGLGLTVERLAKAGVTVKATGLLGRQIVASMPGDSPSSGVVAYQCLPAGAAPWGPR